MAQTQAIKTAEIAPDAGGRKLGAKGQRTRQQLIEATVALLETHGLRDVSVVDVARAAQTSPATFYVYFKGVPEAVLAALEHASQTSLGAGGDHRARLAGAGRREGRGGVRRGIYRHLEPQPDDLRRAQPGGRGRRQAFL
nr:TetR/AcrR family transcriptional regulator [Sphingopyxis sp. PET50]